MALKTHSTNLSSNGLENSWMRARAPADRILMALKMHGALSSAAIGKQLGITGEAARQQLLRLAEQDLVTASSEAKGVGRPVQLWDLTPAAQSRFPDTHASLTAELLDILRSHMGEGALDTVINVREAKTRLRYEAELARKETLSERVSALAALRSEEGYMAEWREEADGSFLLVENHCPICAAAATCAGFCRAELDVFRSALGPEVSIARDEHIVAGGRRCSYVITPKAS
jgi:predicted ArsR family transcriptional regulator